MFNNHKNKYLKYKNKYIHLKNSMSKDELIGGYGATIRHWNGHATFIPKNNINLSSLVLNTDYTGTTSQYQMYHDSLNKLLSHSNGLINLDFINNFYRNIYYDVDNLFSLNIQDIKEDVILSKGNNKYKLSRKPQISDHGATTILFLINKTDECDEKVLKIFNNIDVDVTKIKDYLSLEITNICSEPSIILQPNFYKMSHSAFEIFNFNLQSNFIKTQHHTPEKPDYLYLSCKNNDAINDYIINLILQNINENGNPINFVKYDNLFVTNVNMNGKKSMRYCIIMDKLDGTIKDFLDESANEQFKNEELLYHICHETEKYLNILKGPEHLFTHTDMKCENVFYKNGSDLSKPQIYLADFDKSSISLHNIRFYNDITSNPSLYKKFSSPQSYIGNILKNDVYTRENYEERYLNFTRKQDHIYRLSSKFRQLMGISATPIQFNQLYMRYNMTPYYTSFDMSTLLLSLFKTKIISKVPTGEHLYNLIEKYIHTSSIETLFRIYFENDEDFKGDFGKLLELLLNRPPGESVLLSFVHLHIKELIKDYCFIDSLYLTPQNKISLSLPFKPLPIVSENKSTSFTIVNNSEYNSQIYELIEPDESFKKIYTAFIQLDMPHSIIEYTADPHIRSMAALFVGTHVAQSMGIISPQCIVITNRYSSLLYLGLGLGRSRYIYEYDDIVPDIKNINDLFKLFILIETHCQPEYREKEIIYHTDQELMEKPPAKKLSAEELPAKKLSAEEPEPDDDDGDWAFVDLSTGKGAAKELKNK